MAGLTTIGLGTGSIGDPQLDENRVAELLVGAVEAGVTFFDSARSYGEAEVRIGRHLARFGERIRRATKIGYGIEGTEDWTGACVTAGVEAALARMQVETLDVVFLHSCPIETLERGDAIDALIRAVDAGKIRVAGYSGDGAPLQWAVDSGVFDAVEASYSVLDRANAATLEIAKSRGMLTVAKRVLANAVWRHEERPDADDLGPYWDRFQAFDAVFDDPSDTFVRFVSSSRLVDVTLVGTSRFVHLERALQSAARGPLSQDIVGELDGRYRSVGAQGSAII